MCSIEMAPSSFCIPSESTYSFGSQSFSFTDKSMDENAKTRDIRYQPGVAEYVFDGSDRYDSV